MEKSVVFVKPGNKDIAYSVFDYLGYLLTKRKIPFRKFPMIWELTGISRCLIEAHYSHLKKFGEEIFERTIEEYVRGTTFLTFYEGSEGIIASIRDCVGHTDPVKAGEETVRGYFRRDSLEEALREKRYLNNVIHASGSVKDGQREMGIWFPFLVI